MGEIEAAADALPAAEKQELLLFLAARLRAQPDTTPVPRTFTYEQMSDWIVDDEKEMRRFDDSSLG
ncbi:MAG: hypothetical protein AAB353_01825 [Candidatus Hydrogenedentota bacterium]